MSENSCDGCDKCCKYIALEIDEPETKKEFDQIRWFLIHKDVWIFIDHDDSWNIQFNTPCENLKEGLCTVYETRPQICREYSSENCERFGDGDSFKFLWKTVDEFEIWFAKRNQLF